LLQSLHARLAALRGKEPDLILLLDEFQVLCVQAGFKTTDEALEALRAEGGLRSYRIQSGRIKLFFGGP
jgi:hypothetical protein